MQYNYVESGRIRISLPTAGSYPVPASGSVYPAYPAPLPARPWLPASYETPPAYRIAGFGFKVIIFAYSGCFADQIQIVRFAVRDDPDFHIVLTGPKMVKVFRIGFLALRNNENDFLKKICSINRFIVVIE